MTISNNKSLNIVNESTAELNAQIDRLIEEMYNVFSTYSIDKIKGVCTACCVSAQSVTELENKPARELGWYTIYDYQHSAKYDSTDLVTEAKFLLPRMIELLNSPESQNAEQPPDIRLDNCHFERKDLWHDHEIDLVKRFVKLHFQKVIVEQNLNHPLDDLIVMWYEAGFGLDFISELLIVWQQASPYLKAVKDFAYMVQFDFESLNYKPYSIPEALSNRLTDWVLTEQVLKTFIDEIEQQLESSEPLAKYDAEVYGAVLELEGLLI